MFLQSTAETVCIHAPTSEVTEDLYFLNQISSGTSYSAGFIPTPRGRCARSQQFVIMG